MLWPPFPSLSTSVGVVTPSVSMPLHPSVVARETYHRVSFKVDGDQIDFVEEFCHNILDISCKFVDLQNMQNLDTSTKNTWMDISTTKRK